MRTCVLAHTETLPANKITKKSGKNRDGHLKQKKERTYALFQCVHAYMCTCSKKSQPKVCNLSFASTFLVTFPHKTTQNQRPFSQPSRALPRRLNCRGLRSPHPPRPRIAAATRRLPPHRLPPVAAAVATVSPSSPPSPPALVNQPEAEAAQWRRQRGISRVDAVPRDTQYLWHPRHGGSRGYDFHTQEMMVETYRNEGMQW